MERWPSTSSQKTSAENGSFVWLIAAVLGMVSVHVNFFANVNSLRLPLFSIARYLRIRVEAAAAHPRSAHERVQDFVFANDFVLDFHDGVPETNGFGVGISTSPPTQNRDVFGLGDGPRTRKSTPAQPEISLAQQVHASVYKADADRFLESVV